MFDVSNGGKQNSGVGDDAAAGLEKKCDAIEQVGCISIFRGAFYRGPGIAESRCRFKIGLEHLSTLTGELFGVRVAGDVINREAAAKIYVRQPDTRFVKDLAQIIEQNLERLGVSRRIRILRADVQVDAGEVQVRRIFVLAKTIEALRRASCQIST